MDLKLLLTVFATIFIAEIGDKTQIAALLYASGPDNPKLTVFAGACLALIASTAIAVLAGGWVSQHVNDRYLAWAAGAGFILVGLWTVARA